MWLWGVYMQVAQWPLPNTEEAGDGSKDLGPHDVLLVSEEALLPLLYRWVAE